jgi:hypothetical protein
MEEWRRVAAVLQEQRIDQDGDDDREDEAAQNPVGVGCEPNGQAQQCSEDGERTTRGRLAPTRFGDDEIVVGAGESFTQFSSPSFQC